MSFAIRRSVSPQICCLKNSREDKGWRLRIPLRQNMVIEIGEVSWFMLLQKQ